MPDEWWTSNDLTFTPPEEKSVLVSRPEFTGHKRIRMIVECDWPIPSGVVIGAAVTLAVEAWLKYAAARRIKRN